MGAELRGKTLGIVGLGRIGQEVGTRARAFGMKIVAHDPFISEQVAADAGRSRCCRSTISARARTTSRCTCRRLPETRHLFNAERLARCKPGVRIVNTARGELIDEAALADAIESGHVAGAGLDVFETEPPADRRLTKLPQVVATPHIAASTVEAQELVGIEIAIRRPRLSSARASSGTPSTSRQSAGEECAQLRPFMLLAERLGALVAQLADGRTHGIGIRYYGPLISAHGDADRQRGRRRRASPMLSTA